MAVQYRGAAPFPHIHLPEFLPLDVARALAREFPGREEHPWVHNTHYNEHKLTSCRREAFPALIGRLVDEFNAPPFVRWLSMLTGIEGLLADPRLTGGGMHRSEHGGFLNVHTDFAAHHYQHDWRRQVNLLLFLSEPWDDAWGGALELWDKHVTQCVVRVPPRLNHAVVFTTSEESFHGHPEPLVAPAGIARKSIALYYYTQEAADMRPRFTYYRGRPNDGLRAIPIYLDRRAVALYSQLKRRFGLSDDLISRLLPRVFGRRVRGSATRESNER